MHWVDKFDLFLFDFDGLLVNTEPLHYQAYRVAVEERGWVMPFSYLQFCELAHLNSHAWREAMMKKIPELTEFDSLYEEKRRAYSRILHTANVELMPGVAALLKELEQKNKRRCVVTHSPKMAVMPLRDRNVSLQSIPHWVTREDYGSPKPDPECYLTAIARYGKQGDRIIGFEDSIRGLRALQGTEALPILVCALDHPLVQGINALHFPTLEHISLP